MLYRIGTATINHHRLSRKYINKQGLVEDEVRTEFKTEKEILEAVSNYASPSTYTVVEKYIDKKYNK